MYVIKLSRRQYDMEREMAELTDQSESASVTSWVFKVDFCRKNTWFKSDGYADYNIDKK